MRSLSKWIMNALLYMEGILLFASATGALTLYVAPTGNDAWSGRLNQPNRAGTDGPLASLQGARDAVRKLKREGPLQQPIRVIIADGEYFLAEPVVFGALDSGTAECPISYEAAPGAKPVFTGGRRITGFTKGQNGIWTATVPEVAAGEWYFEQLWVNGKRALRAREPDEFYYYTRGKGKYGIDPATGQIADLSARAFYALPENIDKVPASPDTTLVLYHSWEVTRLRIQAIDRTTNMVVTTAPTPWGFEHWGPSQRYHLENYREALDQPGEWFLSRDGTLYYLPREGEDMATAEVVAPVTEEFVRFAGEASIGWWVENIALKGLAFRHSQYILPPEGHGDGQAEFTIPAVIMADGARNISLDSCEISHLGIYAVWFRRGCRDCAITRSFLYDMGAGGVRIGEGIIQPDEAERTSHIRVDNNIIHSGGRIHMGGHAVWIGHSPYNQITHNDMSDFFYTLVSVGWRWGYGESLAHHNTIEFNHLHHTGWGVLSDMGGVYTLGPSPGTTISNNHIHHIYSYDRYGRGGWGLYNDEGSSYIVMENNLVHHVKTGTYHQHYGRENICRNNILAFSMDGQLQRSRIEDHLSFTYEGNIVYWDDGPFRTAGSINDDNVILRRNLYWKESGPDIDFQGLRLAERQARGWDEGSLIADPLFVDPHNGDFRFREGSPYAKIGFQPFDYTQAGVYGDPEWIALAKSFTFPEIRFAPEPPPPPPLQVNDDFEITPVGAPPTDAQANVEERGDAIIVTDETAAGGTRSLKIEDAAGLQHIFNPHLVYTPNHTGGTSRCSFDMRLGPGVEMYHEWRSWETQPYRVGPTFWIRKGKLQLGEEEVMELPTNEWFHVEVVAKVGEQVDGQWSLTITLPGKQPLTFPNLKVGNPEFRNLTWVGWSSMAQEKSVFYLDNIVLTNE
ncbi:MAG: right-handed parallel beta-helix repeat-containing protein [Candidatus Zipacnadales bacterium]